jgi:short-subunit dehydrogenase
VPTALVTGASAGIGAAFARRLATDGYSLVLVARDKARLEHLASEIGGAEVLVADLSAPESRAAVADRLRDAGRPVDLLINNAGAATAGEFWTTDYTTLHRQLELNVTTALELTHAALPGMISRADGGVINVASVAALIPGRGSTYSAGKAWLVALSEGLAAGLQHTGVRVLALCPGFTRTEFHDRAGIDMSKTPAWMWLDADEVVRIGLRDLRRGKMICVPNWKYKVAAAAMRHLPRPLLQAATRDMRTRTGRDQHDRH